MILNILHEEQLEDFTLNELRGGTMANAPKC